MWMSIGLISFMAIPYLVFNVWLVLTDYYLSVRENRVRPSLKRRSFSLSADCRLSFITAFGKLTLTTSEPYFATALLPSGQLPSSCFFSCLHLLY